MLTVGEIGVDLTFNNQPTTSAIVSASKTGYKAIAVAGIYNDGANASLYYQFHLNESAQNLYMGVRRVNNAAFTGTFYCTVHVLYVKNGFYS